MAVPVITTEDDELILTEDGFPLLGEGLWDIPVFPDLPGIAFPVGRSENWSALRQEAVSGNVTVIELYQSPRKTYKLDINVLRNLTQTELQDMLGFIDETQNGAVIFYYDDRDDNTAVNQLIGEGDGATQDFQLCRAPDLGEPSNIIQSPKPYEVQTISLDGVAQVSGTDYTLSTLGAVHFTVAPAAGVTITWDGSYYWAARFDQDMAGFANLAYGFWNLKSITFTTEPL